MVAKYNGKIVMQGNNIDHNICELIDMKSVKNVNDEFNLFNGGNNPGINLTHQRLGHVSVSTIQKMKNKNYVDGLDVLTNLS